MHAAYCAAVIRCHEQNVLELDYVVLVTMSNFIVTCEQKALQSLYIRTSVSALSSKVLTLYCVSSADSLSAVACTTLLSLFTNSQQGIAHGLGALTFINGEQYRGEFVRDRRCGRGICSYPNGGRYCGNWLRDVYHGFGACAYSNGKLHPLEVFILVL
jgi:MORN repeat